MSSQPPHIPPVTQEDIHVLIAFASKIIGRTLATPNKTLQNKTFVPKYSTLPAATNKRTLPVLDVIASLSVFQDRGQVVAIALQMNQDTNSITLSVAENRPNRVEPRVVEQIGAIWTILRSLSLEYCKRRSLSQAARVELVRLVYTYCWEKMNVRVKKWWPCLDSLSMKITTYLYIDGNKDLSGYMHKFLGAAVMLRQALPVIDNRPDHLLPIDGWSAFSDRMDMAVEMAVEILNDDGHCEAWGKRFQDSKSPIDVRRALEKLTLLHRSIGVSVRFATSPRHRSALSYHLTIHPVTPPPPRQITLPSSAEDWETIVNDVCAGNDFTTLDWSRTQAIALTEHFKPCYLCPTHCECSLIAHLEAAHTSGTRPAFSYIGGSKLSCRACMLWIAAFNRRGGRQYFTRGTHGKWSWPWAAPGPDNPHETGVVAEQVRAECVQFLKATGCLRSAEDGLRDTVARRAPEVVRKMDLEVEAAIENMLRELRSEKPK